MISMNMNIDSDAFAKPFSNLFLIFSHVFIFLHDSFQRGSRPLPKYKGKSKAETAYPALVSRFKPSL